MSFTPITYLYTPASSYQRLEKSLKLGADVVIFDLEDAVIPSMKAEARSNLIEFLQKPKDSGISMIHVRINALDSPWGHEDINALTEAPNLAAIRVPKVSCVSEIGTVHAKLPKLQIHALIEDAQGVIAMRDICRIPEVTGVSLGDNDLRAALHLRGESVMDNIRTQLVVELAAAGKCAPAGSVYPKIKDIKGLYQDTVRLRNRGFAGRSAIHPDQLQPIRAAFEPTEEEFARARQVVAAADLAQAEGKGAILLEDGSFIDQPFISDARYILSLATH